MLNPVLCCFSHCSRKLHLVIIFYILVSWQKKSLLYPVAFLFNKHSLLLCLLEGGHTEDTSGPTPSCSSCVGWQWRAASSQGFAWAACPVCSPGSAAEARLRIMVGPDLAPGILLQLAEPHRWAFPFCCAATANTDPPALHQHPCWVNYCLNSPLEMQSIVRTQSVTMIKSVLVQSAA